MVAKAASLHAKICRVRKFSKKVGLHKDEVITFWVLTLVRKLMHVSIVSNITRVMRLT